MTLDLSDYVDVPTRIAEFKTKFPEGSLQSELHRLEGGWLCKAWAYRTPDDVRPGIGHAFEPVPGKTPFTRDSEAMNAETSAWGRAIVALGFETKHIASANEVAAREEPKARPKAKPKKEEPIHEKTTSFQPPEGATEPQADQRAKKKGYALLKNLESNDPAFAEVKPYLLEHFGSDNPYKMTAANLDAAIEWMAPRYEAIATQLAGFAAANDEDIPFLPTDS